MAGSGIWLDSETYLQQAGQIWAQQQQQNLQAGHDWASQQIADSLSKLQAMVPQVSTMPTPAPAPAPTPTPAAVAPPVMPTPTPAPPPMPPIGGTPVATPMPGAETGVGSAPPPAPTPQPAVVPPPAPTPSLAETGQNWAQQQIANLLNPSQPAPSSTPATTPSPDLTPPASGTPALPAPAQAQGGVSGGGPIDASSPQAFAQSVAPYARSAAQQLGIDPAWVTAMAASESNYGKAPGNELFGIKALPGQASQSLATHEGEGGGVNVNQDFAAYGSPQDAVNAYVNLIKQHYPGALNAPDLGTFVHGLKQGGYFTAGEDEYKNILQSIANRPEIQAGLAAVNTGVQAAQSAIATRASQFGLGLSSGDAYAFCGPTAAIAFAKTYGRNPTVDEAKQLAQQVGWNPDQGMAGVGSEVKLLNAMGVDAHATAGVDWSQVGRDASGGNPVIIDTPGHYYYVDGYNQQTGQLHVGTSGTDLKGGSEWMTPDQINGMPQSGGSARAAIFADHPLAQSDGLAQSTAKSGQNLTMGTNQPASPSSNPLAAATGQVLSNAPVPFIGGSFGQLGDLLGQNQASLQQGRDLVGGLLAPPVQNAPAPLRSKVDDILQAVQDVGSSATQAGQNLLQQGQNLLQSAPTTIQDILTQNALTSQGIPNIGGKVLEGAGNVLGPLGDLNALQANPYMPSNILGGAERALGQNVVGPAINALLPGGALDTGRQALGQNIAGLAPDMPVGGGALQAAGGLIGAPSSMDQMQTMQDLSQKYTGGRGIPDPSTMTPEDQDKWNNAQMAVAGVTMPGGSGGAVTMADRARAYHVANSIGSLATVSKVAISSVFNPAWSFVTRGAADLTGSVAGAPGGLSRAGAWGRFNGSLIGAQTGMATSGQAVMDALTRFRANPESLANRATGVGDQLFGRATEAPALLHSMFQTFGQHILEQTEVGRLYGQLAGEQGLSGSAARDFVAQGIANPSADILAQAQALGKRAVLRGDLGDVGQYFANMAGQGQGQAGTARSMIGNFLFPVFKVGMNHLTQTLEKGPIGMAGTAFDVARSFAGAGPYAGGHFEQPLSSAVAPLSERFTNNVAGTAVAAFLAMKGLDGTITGDGPSDADQRKVLEGQGWQANSVRLPNGGYISYSGTPLEGTLKLVGNFADIQNGHVPMSSMELQQPLALTAAEHLVGSVLNMVASPTGLETLGNIAELIHGIQTGAPEELQRGGASTVANLASSWLPASSTVRSAEQATDPLMRQAPAGDILGKIATGIPGFAEGVQPRLDALGREVPNPQQGLGALLPARLGAGEPNPILAAMGQVGVAPSAAPPTIAYGPTHEVRLTPQERQTWEQYRGQIIQQAAGPMVNSPDWAQMPPRGQVNALSNIEARAAQAASRMVLRDVIAAPDFAQRDLIPTGRLAPIQGYQPAGLGNQQSMLQQAQSAALMQALLGGRTGRQGLQDAMQNLTTV